MVRAQPCAQNLLRLDLQLLHCFNHLPNYHGQEESHGGRDQRRGLTFLLDWKTTSGGCHAADARSNDSYLWTPGAQRFVDDFNVFMQSIQPDIQLARVG